MLRRAPGFLLASLLAVVAALGVAACGGGNEAASQDVNALLKQTFAGSKKIDSGKLNLTFALDARGRGQVQGPVNLSLSGPLQRSGDKDLP